MIIALHGFLGLPSDWQAFDGAFDDVGDTKHTIRKWDIYHDLPSQPPAPDVYPMRIWAKTFCERLERGWRQYADADSAKPVLIGYSMGGRLALHALIENPNLFSAAIIVSAHPGLEADDFKMQRRLNDAKWAERFRDEEWVSLVRAWGEQDIFSGGSLRPDSIQIKRDEGDFKRVLLSRALQLWSLASQQNLRAELANVKTPTLWVRGEKDRRCRELYSDLQTQLSQNPIHKFAEIPEAGHRVPWDNPAEFVRKIQDFLNNIE